jgi:hypothetical protein
MKMNHPKRGTRINNSKLQAKASEMRHTFLKREIWVLLVVGSIVIANAIVKVHTSIIKNNMIALCVWKRETLEL